MPRSTTTLRAAIFALAAAVAAPPAVALEYPVGAPRNVAGMEIGAVYLQPVTMSPEGMMRKAADSDVHLEADIHALAKNAQGFAEGAWIPFLLVRYEITKAGSKDVIEGSLMAMTASDGPHYGDNVKLAGPGRYKLKYTIYPPDAPENALGHHFGRHTDRETGVQPWFKPFEVEWQFVYAGIGKKGGY